MNEKIEKIINHVKEHKVEYILGGITLGSAIFTGIKMRDRHAVVGNAASDGPDVATMRSPSGKAHINGHTDSGKAHINGHTIFSFMGKNSNNKSIVNVIEREGRGHPGYIVRCLENEIGYLSQKLACDDLDINYKHMSDHLNGRRPDINGLHFERIKVA
jgi:hypothetical protein